MSRSLGSDSGRSQWADPAEALAANEQLTIRFNRRAQSNDNTIDLSVDLLAGDTPDDQVTKINTALADTSLDVTAFINATGHLSVRANEYGEDYRVYLLSDLAGGAGTTGVGNVELDDFGTELIGLIGGTKATTINDTTLRGDKGYRTEGIEVTVPDDTSVLPVKSALLMVSPIVFTSHQRTHRQSRDLAKPLKRCRFSDYRPRERDHPTTTANGDQEERLRRQFTLRVTR